MPVTPRYSWRQSHKSVELNITLQQNVKPVITITSTSIAVNSPPYLLSIVLAHDIQIAASKVIPMPGGTLLKLRKATAGHWDTLEFTGAKSDLEARRKAGIEALQQHEAAEREARKTAAAAASRATLKHQMALESAEGAAIDEAKATVKAEAERSMFEALAKVQEHDRQLQAASAASTGEASTARATEAAAGGRTSLPKKSVSFAADESSDEEQPASAGPSSKPAPSVEPSIARRLQAAQAAAPPPAPRAAGTVSFKHSQRIFPTPARESRAKQEADWLAANQARMDTKARLEREAAGRGENDYDLVGEQDEAAPLAQRDPLLLKERGDGMMRVGDAVGALNAYTSALLRAHATGAGGAACSADGLQDGAALAARTNRSAALMTRGAVELAVRDTSLAAVQLVAQLPASTGLQVPAADAGAWAKGTPMLEQSRETGAAWSRARQEAAAASSSADSAVRAGWLPRLVRAEEAAPSTASSASGAALEAGDTDAHAAAAGVAWSLMKVLARRAAAYSRMGFVEAAQADLRAAQAVAAAIADWPVCAAGTSAQRMATALNQDLALLDKLANAASEKAAGDSAMAASDWTSAVAAYNRALATAPDNFPALANRSAAAYALGDIGLCVSSAAAALLLMDKATSAVACTAPSMRSARGQSVAVKLHVRIGAAQAAVRDWESATAAYRAAHDIDPTNEKVRADMQACTAKFAILDSSSAPMPGAGQ